MNLLRTSWLAALLVGLLSTGVATAASRALLIGISSYKVLSKLENPKVDVTNAAKKLKDAGYQVTICLDSWDHVPIRSWPLFKARNVLRTLFQSDFSLATR